MFYTESHLVGITQHIDTDLDDSIENIESLHSSTKESLTFAELNQQNTNMRS